MGKLIKILVILIATLSCSYREIQENKILCTSTPRESGSGLVQVIIDAATVIGGEYEYTSDPQFSWVNPSNTIPA